MMIPLITWLVSAIDAALHPRDTAYKDGCNFALTQLRMGTTPEYLCCVADVVDFTDFDQGIIDTVLLWRRGQMFFNRSLRRAK